MVVFSKDNGKMVKDMEKVQFIIAMVQKNKEFGKTTKELINYKTNKSYSNRQLNKQIGIFLLHQKNKINLIQ